MSRDTREVCPATSHGIPRRIPAPEQADRARFRHSPAYSRARSGGSADLLVEEAEGARLGDGGWDRAE